ncbi:MAG: glycerophosphodiester phosphodiesterase [Thermomicrobiales bacterium]
MSGRAVEVIGHAGAAGFFPHNSRDSLLKAIELGVDRIEVDIITALGDVIILSHDANIVLDGIPSDLREVPLEQVRVVLTGTLTLHEALEITENRCPLLLDIKGQHLAEPLIEALSDSPASQRMSACGTFGRTLKALGDRYPEMDIGLSRGHALTRIRSGVLRRIAGPMLSLLQVVPLTVAARWFGAREVMLYHGICTRPLVFACHATGLRVNAWTVDEPEDIRSVLRSGVDGVISNRPDRVFEILNTEGYERIARM